MAENWAFLKRMCLRCRGIFTRDKYHSNICKICDRRKWNGNRINRTTD